MALRLWASITGGSRPELDGSFWFDAPDPANNNFPQSWASVGTTNGTFSDAVLHLNPDPAYRDPDMGVFRNELPFRLELLGAPNHKHGIVGLSNNEINLDEPIDEQWSWYIGKTQRKDDSVPFGFVLRFFELVNDQWTFFGSATWKLYGVDTERDRWRPAV